MSNYELGLTYSCKLYSKNLRYLFVSQLVMSMGAIENAAHSREVPQTVVSNIVRSFR